MTVTVDVAIPSAAMEVGLAARVDVPVSGEPTTTCTVLVSIAVLPALSIAV